MSVPADLLPLRPNQVAAMTAVTAAGGVAVFPAETVYGLAADPRHPDAVRRLATLKQRDPDKPCSVLFWTLADALAALEEAGTPVVVRRAVTALLPGPIGLVVPNPERHFACATGSAPATLGIRVPRLTEGTVGPPIVQTSANRAGSRDPETLEAVPGEIRDACELVLDAGPRPGVPSTIVDLRGITTADPGGWKVLREGAVPTATVRAALADAGSDAQA